MGNSGTWHCFDYRYPTKLLRKTCPRSILSVVRLLATSVRYPLPSLLGITFRGRRLDGIDPGQTRQRSLHGRVIVPYRVIARLELDGPLTGEIEENPKARCFGMPKMGSTYRGSHLYTKLSMAGSAEIHWNGIDRLHKSRNMQSCRRFCLIGAPVITVSSWVEPAPQPPTYLSYLKKEAAYPNPPENILPLPRRAQVSRDIMTLARAKFAYSISALSESAHP
ncbi:hypothetical protein F5B19DRAFT_399240 [Rostrohypoxylon terebratum]|nr:hypothetical protein F5B19DRAFT_399240 [Rostrohypoxylon terebratum]